MTRNTSQSTSDSLSERDSRFFAQTPKWVLYAICKHMAAKDCGSYEDALENGAYLGKLHEEWKALHASGAVSKAPPNVTP